MRKINQKRPGLAFILTIRKLLGHSKLVATGSNWLQPVCEVRSEDVERLCEDVVVDEAGVDGEEGHQEDDVPAAEEDAEDLALAGKLLKSGSKEMIIGRFVKNKICEVGQTM